jgi:hypothetical protein
LLKTSIAVPNDNRNTVESPVGWGERSETPQNDAIDTPAHQKNDQANQKQIKLILANS